MRVFFITLAIIGLPLFASQSIFAAGLVPEALAQSIDVSKECDGIKCLVPCNGPDCQTCSLIKLANNIIKWLVGFLVAAGTLVFAYGGFLMVTSAGDTGKVSQAKSLMTNVVIGLVIFLTGYIVVDTVLKAFLPNGKSEVPGFGPWNQIQCVAQPSFTDKPAGTLSSVPSQIPAGCLNCSGIPSGIPTNGNACSGGGQCQMNAQMADRVGDVFEQTSGLRVSEAWPPAGYSTSDPSGIHASACHGTATCIDMSYDPGVSVTGARVKNDTQIAASKNLTVVYEVPNEARAAELKSQGATNVLVVSGINREHYSVYMCDIDSSPNACRK